MSAQDLSKLLRLLGSTVVSRQREEQQRQPGPQPQPQQRWGKRAAPSGRRGTAADADSGASAAAAAALADGVLGPGRQIFLDAAWSALSEHRRVAGKKCRSGGAAGSSTAGSGSSSSSSSSGSSSRQRLLEELTPTQLVDAVWGLAACRYDNTDAYDTVRQTCWAASGVCIRMLPSSPC